MEPQCVEVLLVDVVAVEMLLGDLLPWRRLLRFYNRLPNTAGLAVRLQPVWQGLQGRLRLCCEQLDTTKLQMSTLPVLA